MVWRRAIGSFERLERAWSRMRAMLDFWRKNAVLLLDGAAEANNVSRAYEIPLPQAVLPMP